jgi:hypothetical protein
MNLSVQSFVRQSVIWSLYPVLRKAWSTSKFSTHFQSWCPYAASAAGSADATTTYSIMAATANPVRSSRILEYSNDWLWRYVCPLVSIPHPWSFVVDTLSRRKRRSVAYQRLLWAHFKVVGFLLARVMVTTRRPSEDAVSKIKEGEINKRGSHVES